MGLVLGKSWRDVCWDQRDSLKSDVKKYTTGKDNIPCANIVLFGEVGSGKSSFFNTIYSIFKGQFSSRALVGGADHGVTKQFRKYRIGGTDGQDGPGFCLCDTMGMEADQGLDIQDIPYILDGHIPTGFTFPTKKGERISPKSAGFVRKPGLEKRMHCICYVIDAQTVDHMTNKTAAKIKALKELACSRHIHFVILLTKIDLVCGLVATDTKVAYQSVRLARIAEKTGSLTETPTDFIFLIKNYEKEIELDNAIDVLALTALKQVLRFADDVLAYYAANEDLAGFRCLVM